MSEYLTSREGLAVLKAQRDMVEAYNRGLNGAMDIKDFLQMEVREFLQIKDSSDPSLKGITVKHVLFMTSLALDGAIKMRERSISSLIGTENLIQGESPHE